MLEMVERELRPLLEEELEVLRTDTTLRRSDRIMRLSVLKMLLQSRTTGVQKGLKEYFEMADKISGGGTRRERSAAQAHEDAERAFTDPRA